MKRHDLFYKGQPQAISPGKVGSIPLIKFLKDMAAGFFVHAAAVIGQGKDCSIILTGKAEKKFAVFGGKLPL